jgi:electron transfer flavoprotein beta subunit
MLIIALLKGVPARTTKVVTVGGVLKREEMDIVLNPHDAKAIEAADFVKQKVGGKIVAISMGPDIKLSPLMGPLYHAEVFGVDEAFILSDRKMAGADTLATSYAVSLGVRKTVERHVKPVEELISLIKSGAPLDSIKARATELYSQNLLPNSVYSDLAPVKDSIIKLTASGAISPQEAVSRLEKVRDQFSRFVIVSGIKTTDGETGSVGPQVAEALSEATGADLPHLTYVEDFDIDTTTLTIYAERRIGRLVQKLELHCPALLTISPEYRPRAPDASGQVQVRSNNFKGKVSPPIKWNADELSADPARLGLAGSPTIVGPGVDIGKPPVQKVIGKTLVFTQRLGKIVSAGKELGPFDRGDMAESLPAEVLTELMNTGAVGFFTMDMLQEEMFS